MANKKHWFSRMFGFIIDQPIHLTLRQIRVVPLALLFSSQLLLWTIVEHLDKLSDTEEKAMAYATIAVTLITAIWKGIDSLHKPNEKDYDYEEEWPSPMRNRRTNRRRRPRKEESSEYNNLEDLEP